MDSLPNPLTRSLIGITVAACSVLGPMSVPSPAGASAPAAASHPPRSAGLAVLGATERTWIARLGPRMSNTGGGEDGWHPCPGHQITAQLMATFIGGRAVAIDAQRCPGQTVSMAVRMAQARSYLPPGSVRVGTTTTEDGPALIYRSTVLAREVMHALFIDCDSNPVTAGTFTLTPNFAGDDWILAVGSCG